MMTKIGWSRGEARSCGSNAGVTITATEHTVPMARALLAANDRAAMTALAGASRVKA